MTKDEYLKYLRECRIKVDKYTDLASKSKRSYEYWKQKKGIKAFINQKIFFITNQLLCDIGRVWLKRYVNLRLGLYDTIKIKD